MKTEVIMANIKTAVFHMEEEEQKNFKFIMSHSEVTSTPFDAPGFTLGFLYRELEQEFKMECAKSKGGASLVSRTKLANKLIKSMNANREQFQKGWKQLIKGEQYQVLMFNGYYAVCLSEGHELDVPMHDDEEPKCLPNIEKCFPEYERDYTSAPAPVEQVTAALKQCAAEQKAKGIPAKKRDRCIISFNGIGFDAEYFVNTCKLLGDDVTLHFDSKNPKAVLVLESENGKAILCPVNMQTEPYAVIA